MASIPVLILYSVTSWLPRWKPSVLMAFSFSVLLYLISATDLTFREKTIYFPACLKFLPSRLGKGISVYSVIVRMMGASVLAEFFFGNKGYGTTQPFVERKNSNHIWRIRQLYFFVSEMISFGSDVMISVVLQKLYVLFPPTQYGFVVTEITLSKANFKQVVENKYGCRVIQFALQVNFFDCGNLLFAIQRSVARPFHAITQKSFPWFKSHCWINWSFCESDFFFDGNVVLTCLVYLWNLYWPLLTAKANPPKGSFKAILQGTGQPCQQAYCLTIYRKPCSGVVVCGVAIAL